MEQVDTQQVVAGGMNQAELDATTIQNGKFRGTYWQWLKNQFQHLDRSAWVLYGIGLGIQLGIFIMNPISITTVISLIGIAFGFLCTIMMATKGWQNTLEADGTVTQHRVSGRSANGLLGSASVIFYIILNAQAGHWFSVLDQMIFFFAIDFAMLIKWRTWGHGDSEATTNATWKTWLYAILGILVLWAILYPVGIFLHDSQPLVDSLVLAFGAVASITYVKRNSISYQIFILSNLVNVVLWFGALDQGLSPASLSMLVMTIMYMASSVYGYWNMRYASQGLRRKLPEYL